MRVMRAVFWLVLAAVTAAFVVPRLLEWHVVSGIASLRPGWLVVAAAVLFGHYVLIFALWTLLLRTLRCDLPVAAALRAFCLSLLPKYVPGKVVAAGLRARLATEAGAPLLETSASLLLEMALGVGSAGVVALVGLAIGLPPGLAGAARWLALALCVGALGSLVLFTLPLPAWRWKRRVDLHLTPATALRLGGLLLLYSFGWVIPALSHWALARAMAPLPFRTVVPLGTALAISWGAGALSLIAPAGLGVKDGILFFAVRGVLGERNALLLAALSRALSVALEAAITFGFWIADRLRCRPPKIPSTAPTRLSEAPPPPS